MMKFFLLGIILTCLTRAPGLGDGSWNTSGNQTDFVITDPKKILEMEEDSNELNKLKFIYIKEYSTNDFVVVDDANVVEGDPTSSRPNIVGAFTKDTLGKFLFGIKIRGDIACGVIVEITEDSSGTMNRKISVKNIFMNQDYSRMVSANGNIDNWEGWKHLMYQFVQVVLNVYSIPKIENSVITNQQEAKTALNKLFDFSSVPSNSNGTVSEIIRVMKGQIADGVLEEEKRLQDAINRGEQNKQSIIRARVSAFSRPNPSYNNDMRFNQILWGSSGNYRHDYNHDPRFGGGW